MNALGRYEHAVLRATIDPDWFWSNVIPVPESGCMIWMNSTTQNGYGLIGVSNPYQTSVLAHRVAWVLAGRQLPQGNMNLDHLCRVRCCVNVKHLEPTTQLENFRRGTGPQRLREYFASITHCPQGHEYSEANTYFYKEGYGKRKASTRICKTCSRLTPEQKAALRARLAERRAA